MTTTSGLSPEAVPERATRAGETREAMTPHQEWSWVEPRVWTARMLAALEKGVKGGKWYNLITHIRLPNAFFARHGFFSLQCAHAQVRQSSCRSTIDWRAGCGRSARPVRREGGSNPIGSPYPYHGAHRHRPSPV
jgi:hypothetical protein